VTTPDIRVPSNSDILKFCTDMLQVRGDRDQVKQVIEQNLQNVHPALRTAYLTVTMHTLVSEFFAPLADRVDRELGFQAVKAGLDYQAGTNGGHLDTDDDEDNPPRPRLSAVRDT